MNERTQTIMGLPVVESAEIPSPGRIRFLGWSEFIAAKLREREAAELGTVFNVPTNTHTG